MQALSKANQERLRRKIAQLRKDKERRSDAAVAAMHAAIERGMSRNEAIIEAKKQGARSQAIADAKLLVGRPRGALSN